jgi:hypothetical protein
MAEDRFSPEQVRLLGYVLDELIPPSADGRLPSGGELGLHDHLATALRPLPALLEMVVQSLAALDRLARQRDPGGLPALTPSARAAVLTELAASEHAVPPILALHAFGGYYHHPRVVAALGLEPRPPHPHGYAMEPNDLSLLEPVQRRGKMYREC